MYTIIYIDIIIYIYNYLFYSHLVGNFLESLAPPYQWSSIVAPPYLSFGGTIGFASDSPVESPNSGFANGEIVH